MLLEQLDITLKLNANCLSIPFVSYSRATAANWGLNLFYL